MLKSSGASDGVTLVDLHDVVLSHVACYLPKTSRALFASTLTAPSASCSDGNWNGQPSVASRAIVSTGGADGWDVVDFLDIDEELARRLSDDDLAAVLYCINAKELVRVIKLAGLIGSVTGRGLAPLRGSTVIEQIDLITHVRSRHVSSPQMKEEDVAPILCSIVYEEGCSLKHIQFPPGWHVFGENLSPFSRQFMARLGDRDVPCGRCSAKIGVISEWPDICYNCTNIFCEDCTFGHLQDQEIDQDPWSEDYGEPYDEDDGIGFIDTCESCWKQLCTDCTPMRYCSCGTGEHVCRDCRHPCKMCNKVYSKTCRSLCSGCGDTCGSCAPKTQCIAVGCPKSYCYTCKYKGQDVKACSNCTTCRCWDCEPVDPNRCPKKCEGCSPVIKCCGDDCVPDTLCGREWTLSSTKGNPVRIKVCSACESPKGMDEFSPKQQSKSRHGRCNTCVAESVPAMETCVDCGERKVASFFRSYMNKGSEDTPMICHGCVAIREEQMKHGYSSK